MNSKERELAILIYSVIVALEIAYLIMGNYITNYWKFGLEDATLLVGNRKLSPDELNLLYAVFCISFSSSLAYCIASARHKIKIFIFVIISIITVLLYLLPEVAAYVAVWPVVIISRFMNMMGTYLRSDFLIMSALTMFTIAIYSYIIKVLKRDHARNRG